MKTSLIRVHWISRNDSVKNWSASHAHSFSQTHTHTSFIRSYWAAVSQTSERTCQSSSRNPHLSHLIHLWIPWTRARNLIILIFLKSRLSQERLWRPCFALNWGQDVPLLQTAVCSQKCCVTVLKFLLAFTGKCLPLHSQTHKNYNLLLWFGCLFISILSI